MAIARMEARRQRERLDHICAVICTAWVIGIFIGVAQGLSIAGV